MDKISCDVCCDLIPLVIDNAASEDSRLIVTEHIKNCDACRNYMGSFPPDVPEINEKSILHKIKKSITIVSLLAIIAGASLGVAFSNSADVLYNIIIMPALGALGYSIIRKSSWIIIPSLFVLTLITVTISSSISDALYWGVIYSVLSALGILIAALLHYAFKKEKSK